MEQRYEKTAEALADLTPEQFAVTWDNHEAGLYVGHLGHVFSINSAALRLIPVAELEAKGYGQFLDLFDPETSEVAR